MNPGFLASFPRERPDVYSLIVHLWKERLAGGSKEIETRN